MLVPQAYRQWQNGGFPWVGSECAWRSARLLPSPTPGGFLQPGWGPGLPWASHSPRDSCQAGPGGLFPTASRTWKCLWRHWTQPKVLAEDGISEVRQPEKMETDRPEFEFCFPTNGLASSGAPFIICKVTNYKRIYVILCSSGIQVGYLFKYYALLVFKLDTLFK